MPIESTETCTPITWAAPTESLLTAAATFDDGDHTSCRVNVQVLNGVLRTTIVVKTIDSEEPGVRIMLLQGVSSTVEGLAFLARIAPDSGTQFCGFHAFVIPKGVDVEEWYQTALDELLPKALNDVSSGYNR